MSEKIEKITMPLRTIEDLTRAHEWIMEKQLAGTLDSKTADSINTTLKGAVYLNAKLKIDAAKIFLQAQIKKVIIPADMLPDLTSNKK